jgi:transcriptional regulator with XRE-family HTH domain
MNTLKKVRLQRAGWAVGDAAKFVNLSPQEAQFVELKLALAAGVRQLRERRGMTQTALAEQLGSSQSRIAKMEAGDRSVTVDLMMRSLLAIGATPGEIAKLIKRSETRRAARRVPCQNRVKTPRVGAAGVSFERKADSPNC